MDFPLKIVHRDELSARDALSAFEPLDDECIESYARKRDGRRQFVLLRDITEAQVAAFKIRCLEIQSVEEVWEISLDEFRNAPSNSI